MALSIVRRIRGNVHGSVDISWLEDKVIGHPYFQRLRRIKQLAFLQYVFPGATHTRFEHSLGVLHLVKLAWDKLLVNHDRLVTKAQQIPAEQRISKHGEIIADREFLKGVLESDYILQCTRLAALLHDVGHSPYSHSGESFFPSYEEVLAANDKELPDYIRDYLQRKVAASSKPHPVRHEIYSILLVDRILRDIYGDYPNSGPEPRDVGAILIPSLGVAKTSPLAKTKSLYFCHQLISGELDLDRMDYLLRDSRECGVVYGVFDVGRILDSLQVYREAETGEHHVAIGLSGLSAFEDYLRARYSMYLQLYFHKTAVASEAMLRFIKFYVRQWQFPAKLEEFAAVDELSFIPAVLKVARQHLPEAQLEPLENHLRNLFLDRRLWKRVYEITSGPDKTMPKDVIYLVEQYLLLQGLHFLTLSSENDLTRLRPREHNAASPNNLRLIKRNELQQPTVVPIEDHSRVVAQNEGAKIWRVYVDLGHLSDSEAEQKRRALREHLRQAGQSPS